MKKHNIVAIVGLLALVANLIVPGLALGATPNSTGTADLTCDGSPSFGDIIPADAFDFYNNGSSGAMIAKALAQEAYNNPNVTGLSSVTDNDFVSIRDPRDPSAACAAGADLTLNTLNTGNPAVETTARYFDSANGSLAGFYIALDQTYVVSSANYCPVGWTENNEDVCIKDDARCGAGVGNPSVLCNTGNFGTSAADYDGTDFATLTTYTTGPGLALGTADNTPGPLTLLEFGADVELNGDAGIGVSYGVEIDAGQPVGTYVLDLEYVVATL